MLINIHALCLQMHYDIHRNYILGKQQGISEVFDSCDRHSNLNGIGFKSSILQPVWPWNLMDDLAKTIEHLSNSTLSFVPHFTSIGEIKLELQSGNTSWSRNQRFFVLCDLEIWWMTLKITRAPLLCCFKICASFYSHRWIQSGFIVRKRSIRVKIDDFFPCDLEIWWMMLKNYRATLLYYAKFCASFMLSKWSFCLERFLICAIVVLARDKIHISAQVRQNYQKSWILNSMDLNETLRAHHIPTKSKLNLPKSIFVPSHQLHNQLWSGVCRIIFH